MNNHLEPVFKVLLSGLEKGGWLLDLLWYSHRAWLSGLYCRHMNPTEISTQRYFKKSGFSLAKIPETSTKTPDFEGDNILVEVKKIDPEEKEGLHKDSTYNAVKNNLKDD